MKKCCILLAAVLLMSLCVSAWAEDGVNVEVIKVNGVSVVVLTPEATQRRARGIIEAVNPADFMMPDFLTLIEEEAFAGIGAETVEVSGSVVAIEARAFANCERLLEITIPATVLKIDESALEGCRNVTVYGEKGSAAEHFVEAVNEADPNAGFLFVEITVKPEEKDKPDEAIIVEPKPVDMPFVPAWDGGK